MSTHRILTELRGLLADRPSWRAFRQLSLLLDACPPHDLALALDYVQGIVLTWPPELRRTPKPWLRRLLAGKDEPRVALCGVLQLPRRSLNTAVAARLLRRPELRNLHTLDLSHNPAAGAALTALGEAPWPHLHHLLLPQTHPTPEALQALAALSTTPRLHTLDLSDNALDDAALLRFIRHLDASPLRHLALQDNLLHHDAPIALVSVEHLQHLHTLNLARNNLSVDAVISLFDAHLPDLTELRLVGNTAAYEISTSYLQPNAARAAAICPDVDFTIRDPWW